MSAIRTVNLSWERKNRGTYPVSRFALDDSGALLLAVPRPLEARAYDFKRISLDGSETLLNSFSVETLIKLELISNGAATGMTSDDFYLFSAGTKGRLMGDRRLLALDSSLSENGRLAVIFSDMAGASFLLGCGELDGSVRWLRDADEPLTSVTISRAGDRIAFSAESGSIWLVDANRQDLWAFGQPEPIRALASFDGGIAYGTEEGAVGLIDSEGTRIWETRLTGEIIALALSRDGSRCAALARVPEEIGGTQLACFNRSGQNEWEMKLDQRLLGITISPDGLFLATGARDGTTSVYEIEEGEPLSQGLQLPEESLNEAIRLQNAGDPWAAMRQLGDSLQQHPADIAVYNAYAQLSEQIIADTLAHSRNELENGEPSRAIELLDPLCTYFPSRPELIALRNECRLALARLILQEARMHRSVFESHEAKTKLETAIQLAPSLIDARQELTELYEESVRRCEEEAEGLLVQNELDAALMALERAQALQPTVARAARLAGLSEEREFAAGLALYNSRRYREAVFQFKKVLARHPDHAEARRYLGFAENFSQESAENLSDRFSRLE